MTGRWRRRRLRNGFYWWVIGRRLMGGAAAVHVTAEDEARQARRWCAGAKQAIVPYVVDLSEYGPDAQDDPPANPINLPTGDGTFKLLFLSRVHPKKGVEYLIDAAAELHHAAVDLCVVVAGPPEPDYQAELESQVAEHGLQDVVHFVGMVRGPQKVGLYRWADLFVLPTHQENFGIVLAEAMAAGTPVITTRGTDIWRELEQHGAYIVPHDGRAIADTVRDAIADRPALADRTERGRRGIAAWLDPEQTVQRFVRMYREAMSRQNGATVKTG